MTFLNFETRLENNQPIFIIYQSEDNTFNSSIDAYIIVDYTTFDKLRTSYEQGDANNYNAILVQ